MPFLTTRRMLLALLILVTVSPDVLHAATTQPHYYAYDTVVDKNGVIATWYKGLNGPVDYRARIAAETLKRYPWTPPGKAPAEYPEYIWNGHWAISPDGTISIPMFGDWDTADMGQRSAYVLSSLVDYYRYTGDPAAVAHITWQANQLIDYCLTDEKHPWPGILISVPIKGKPYGRPDPRGMIQLDIVAEVGTALLKAYEVTGNTRWFDTAKHWADLLAEHRDQNLGIPPWPRYAQPENAPWQSFGMTGGVAYVLYFFDELIRLGYTGKGNDLVASRQAGVRYLSDVLLPRWTANETWGFNYWDVPANWQQLTSTEFASRYMMDHPTDFPNWRTDVRNILSIFLNRTSANPAQRGEVYSGAWAYPESFGCCGRSLWYTPMALAIVYAQYGVQGNDEWGREMARRQQILATYDIHETGVSEDNIDGGDIVNGAWFKIAHPMALKYMLNTIAWMPGTLGANRENHIVRSTAVVNSVVYGKGKVSYTTFDAPAGTTDVLRLTFTPTSVTADGKLLAKSDDLMANGFTVKPLPNGDSIVSVRHDGAKAIVIEGDDPQQSADDAELTYDGKWETAPDPAGLRESVHTASTDGSSVCFIFTGNQVRLLGKVDRDGGRAGVYVDGTKQLVGIDCWNPSPRSRQLLYYRNGLADGSHTLKIVARGTKNPYSGGTKVYVDEVQWSSATGEVSRGEGGGPTETQRWIFGYPWRHDYIDSQGNAWRPGTEFAIHDEFMFDSVASSWWTEPVPAAIANTSDPDLYKYGAHATDFSANFTVGPGAYHARIKLAATRLLDPSSNCMSIYVNDRPVVDRMDVVATAGGMNRAIDLVFNDIAPKSGMVDIRFVGGDRASSITGDAFVQAIEVGLGSGGTGVIPVSTVQNLLGNPGFEKGVPTVTGSAADVGWMRWSYAFTGPTDSARISPESQSADPSVGSGKESLRVTGNGKSTVEIYQDVMVNPNAAYTASAWVRDTGVTGQAGIAVQELANNGSKLTEHWQPAPSGSTYAYVPLTFTTQAKTEQVRVILRTVDAGLPVSYDNAALVGPAVASVVSGVVTSEGKTLPNAVVSVGEHTAVTGADGAYRIEGLSAGPSVITVRAAKDGYYAQRKLLLLWSRAKSVDYDLTKVGTNLLNDAGFDDGWSDLWMKASESQTRVFHTLDGENPIPYQSGEQAVAMSGVGTGRVYQTAVVQPNQEYAASAWVKAVGSGWNRPDQKAGLVVREYDRLNNPIAEHTIPAKASQSFAKLSTRFTTTKKTVFVRVEGYADLLTADSTVVFDSFELSGPVGPALAPLSGAVTAGGKPIAGAVIKSDDGKHSVTTAEDGYYSLNVPDGAYHVRITKDGFYPQRRNITVRGTAVFTASLQPVDGNLLVNAGFDDGWPDGWQIETLDAKGEVRPGHMASVWGNYPTFYQTGEEATEILSGTPDGSGGRIVQKVAVQPGKAYAASAWFRAYGPSWGRKPEQKAGLFVQELDASGKVIVDHPTIWATKFDDWQKLSMDFATGPQTASIRIGGYAFLVDDYNTTTYRALFDTFEVKPSAGSR